MRKTHSFLRFSLLCLLLAISVLLGSCGEVKRDVSLIRLGKISNETGIPESWFAGGSAFTFLVAAGRSYPQCDDVWQEEDPTRVGECVYDAIQQRNRNMLDRYGVEIAVMTTAEELSEYRSITTLLNAGDDSFQAIAIAGTLQFSLAAEGYLQDLYNNQFLNLDLEIWDQNFVESMTINDHLYSVTGEFSRMDNQGTHAIAFNKRMIREYTNLPSVDEFYSMARNGEWTLEQLFAACAGLRRDIDGDGNYTSHDQFGMQCYSDTMLAFLQGCEYQIAQREDGTAFGVKINDFTKKFDDIWLKVMVAETSYSLRNRDIDFIHEADPDSVEKCMEDNRLLFAECTMQQIEDMRRYDIDFGILPIPKYSSQQLDYVCAASEDMTVSVSIPITNLDDEFTAYALTAFSWEGKDLLTPAYFEKTLVGKVITDMESWEMLDIIYSSKSYDLGVFTNWGREATWLRRCWNEKVFQMAATLARISSHAHSSMEKQMSSEYFYPYSDLEPDKEAQS